MERTFIAIVVQNIDNTQRNQIQETIKKYATSWWHEFLDLWILETDETMIAWRERLEVIFSPGGSQLLIINVADTAPRWCGFILPYDQSKWLRENIRGSRRLLP
jgi:hypothetical protein